MNVTITTIVSPFSFYCKAQRQHKNEVPFTDGGQRTKTEVSDLKHGQYVAVWWEDSWARGVVEAESRILIWLVDHGIYLYPNERTLFVTLPAQYQKQPSRVFEVSIHGVTPVDIATSDACEITDIASTTWTQGATVRAKELIESASRVVFVPIALLSTNNNDIVIGDLYLLIGNDYVNIADRLEAWSVFLKQNKSSYIQSLSTYYAGSQRKHSACLLKPQLPGFELPTMILSTTLDEYNAICAKYCEAPNIDGEEQNSSDSSVSGGTYVGTVVTFPSKPKKHADYQLSAAQEAEYEHLWTVLQGKEYNLLDLVRQKLQDLIVCDKYKNVKRGIGRANSRKRERASEVKDSEFHQE